MPRRALLSRSLPFAVAVLALAACSDYPAGPGAMPSPLPLPAVSLDLAPGDSVDLTLLASERLGLYRVADCTAINQGVVELLDTERLVAVAAGESVVRCFGTADRRLDPTIDGWRATEEHPAWVAFEVRLTVAPLEGPPDEPDGLLEP